MTTHIQFIQMTREHIPLWLEWSHIPHVKDVWFMEGYQTRNIIYQKVAGNGYDHPFMISINDKLIGYIVCCDLYAYRTLCPEPKGLFVSEDPGTFCMDLFIADESYLNKGYGTLIVKSFADYIFTHFNAQKILIDPAVSNHRAIRCYEKAGFVKIKNAFDGVTECCILAKQRETPSP